MTNSTKNLEGKLKLKVNQAKSGQKPLKLKFLGFSLYKSREKNGNTPAWQSD